MAAKPEIVFLYSTFPSKKSALKTADALVKKRLCACANIAKGVTSVYRWKNKVERASEVTLITKTQQSKIAAATKEIKRLHPYKVPCIVALPITQGYAPFLKWVQDETK